MNEYAWEGSKGGGFRLRCGTESCAGHVIYSKLSTKVPTVTLFEDISLLLVLVTKA